jgi:hypothetical protein
MGTQTMGTAAAIALSIPVRPQFIMAKRVEGFAERVNNILSDSSSIINIQDLV